MSETINKGIEEVTIEVKFVDGIWRKCVISPCAESGNVRDEEILRQWRMMVAPNEFDQKLAQHKAALKYAWLTERPLESLPDALK
jgi:hypothetical protein